MLHLSPHSVNLNVFEPDSTKLESKPHLHLESLVTAFESTWNELQVDSVLGDSGNKSNTVLSDSASSCIHWRNAGHGLITLSGRVTLQTPPCANQTAPLTSSYQSAGLWKSGILGRSGPHGHTSTHEHGAMRATVVMLAQVFQNKPVLTWMIQTL